MLGLLRSLDPKRSFRPLSRTAAVMWAMCVNLGEVRATTSPHFEQNEDYPHLSTRAMPCKDCAQHSKRIPHLVERTANSCRKATLKSMAKSSAVLQASVSGVSKTGSLCGAEFCDHAVFEVQALGQKYPYKSLPKCGSVQN